MPIKITTKARMVLLLRILMELRVQSISFIFLHRRPTLSRAEVEFVSLAAPSLEPTLMHPIEGKFIIRFALPHAHYHPIRI